MRTRAQFFLGDPSDVDTRMYLGCIAWDGYPSNDVIAEYLSDLIDENDFIKGVKAIGIECEDFSDPLKEAWPFPWVDDLYLTDYTYAFFDGRAQVTCFHYGWRDLQEIFETGKEPWDNENPKNELPSNVPGPVNKSLPAGKDSIMVVGVSK